MDDLGAAPRPCVTRLVGIFGVELLDVEVLLVGSGDGEPEGNILVMAERNARQPGLTGSDDVPAGRDQMDGAAQGGNLNTAMRVRGEQGLAGGTAGAIHHPIVAAEGRGGEHDAEVADYIVSDFAQVHIGGYREGNFGLER